MAILFFTMFISNFYISMYKPMLLSIYVIRNILVLRLNYIWIQYSEQTSKKFFENVD